MRIRIIWCWLLLAAVPGWAQQLRNPVDVYTRADDATGEVQFLARNPGPVPFQLRVEFSELENYAATVALPYYTVVPPDSAEVALFRLQRQRDGRAHYRVKYDFELGDPRVPVDTSFTYWLPFRHGTAHTMSQGYGGRFSHQGKNAIDFVMPVGTPITAVRGGVVADVSDGSDRRGATAAFAPYSNYVLVYHADGTFATYSHLRRNGSAIAVGDSVAAGELIGYSGNTGWTSGPHLHLEIGRALPMRTATIPTYFLDHNQRPILLREGVRYHAFHPGQPSFEVDTAANVPAPKPIEQNRTFEIVQRDEGSEKRFYARNGYEEARQVTLSLEKQNIRLSKKGLLRFTVPPGTELYLFSARVSDPARPARLEYTYRLETP